VGMRSPGLRAPRRISSERVATTFSVRLLICSWLVD
jgi:hypothetical protein